MKFLNLISLIPILFPFFSFSQLTDLQTSFSIQTENVLSEDSILQSQDQLILHIVPNDLSDMSSLSVNIYVDEEVSVMPEIKLGTEEIQSPQILSAQELIIPAIVIDPELSYRITVSVQNNAGEYLPTFISYYPN